MLLEADHKKILGRLEVGEAVVKLQGRWQYAFTISIPHIDIPKGSVTDALVREKARPYSTCFSQEENAEKVEEGIPAPETQRKKEGIIPDEQALLEDIRNHPYAGVV